METRHPLKSQFGSEFPAICNHCGIMTAWSRKTWKILWAILRDHDHAHWGAVCYAKASTWYNLLANKIWQLSIQPFRRYDRGHRNWKWVMWPWPHPFEEWFVIHISSLKMDLIQTTCLQNFTILAQTVPEISLVAPKFKVGHVTLTMPLLRVICHHCAGTWHSLPVYNIWPL